MKGVFDITPLTMTDYADMLSAVIWFSGCNMRCKYCYNTQVVLEKPKISFKNVVDFLDKRQNKLEAIVFSGGECTINSNFLPLVYAVKQRGFKLKVDTNGSNLKTLKQAINLIDFIALDFKAPAYKFKSITHSNLYDNFIKTLEFLLSINFKFEVRTTIHTDILNEKDISYMAEFLYKKGYKNSYYLQGFLQTDLNFGSLKDPKSRFHKDKISSPLKLEFRNFNTLPLNP